MSYLRTNLFYAILADKKDLVLEILNNESIDVNKTDNHNFTALHHAVIKGNPEVCELLLDHERFDSLVKTYEGCSALMIAILANVPLEVIELLVRKYPIYVTMKNNEEVTPLHEAVKNQRLDIVKVLLQYGANVNDFDLDLENALHLAASNSDFDMIDFLLKETEVDSRAKNRDEMNPLCLLIVRSRNENQDLVIRCFFTMLEHTYDKNPVTGTYAISDIFQCAFLACVYSRTEIVKYLIHNVYNICNTKYDFIRKLTEYWIDDTDEFLYYVLVFLHDDIDRYDKYSFTRFAEINYFMCIRSVIHVINMLLPAYDAVELTVSVLQHLKSIGFNIRVKEFEDQVGALLHTKYSFEAIPDNDLQKIDGIIQYLYFNQFKTNLMIKSFLHSIAIEKNVEGINTETAKKIVELLIRYAPSFFDYNNNDNWKQINDFKNLNPQIKLVVEWMVTNYGNLNLNTFLDIHFVFPLKHFCRNVIRDQLRQDKMSLHNIECLRTLGLPEILINYLVFKE